MDILLDPNIAYLFLVGGLVFLVLAILAPGTGILEIAALFTLLIAAYEVYNLPVNWWALAAIFLGAVMFFVAVRKPGRPVFLVISIVAVVVGSAFLFRGDEWWVPEVNPLLAITASVLSGVFFWIAARKAIEANTAPPTHDLVALVGAVGEAKSVIHTEGSVQVAGELWSARSQQPIQSGARVRVTGREGFILIVESVDQPKS